MVRRIGWLGVLSLLCVLAPAHAADPTDLAKGLQSIDPIILPKDNDNRPDQLLWRKSKANIAEAVLRENAAWAQVTNRQQWEAFRDQRIGALRASLGPMPEVPKNLPVHISRTIDGDGYHIDNLLFETRPGFWVSANLYRPAKNLPSMPGILISHSHHSPKTQGELQDMGVTWARLGCCVLVPDHLGHGERRQHPFISSDSYPKPFKASRQDYYFRYNEALQLHLASQSLMGWMAWDLMRGVDLLIGHAKCDRKRILLIGAVAGGGDPAGVVAALDPRIAVVAPFNFGGVQPDYTMPADPERDFYWFGPPWWESTRCLKDGVAGGCAHWLIAGSVAPRGLIYSYEFGWDKLRDADPAWKRLQKIYSFYDAPDKLAVAHGRGQLKGEPPENTHCNNVGPVHRAMMYPTLQRWLQIDVPAKESSERRTAQELACFTPEAVEKLKPSTMRDVALSEAAARSGRFIEALKSAPAAVRAEDVREAWSRLLGEVKPTSPAVVISEAAADQPNQRVTRVVLETEPGIRIPLLLLHPAVAKVKPGPTVVCIAREGKAGFLKNQSTALSDLLSAGFTICLTDLPGTGETTMKGDRGRSDVAATVAQSEFMLGRTVVGGQLRDLRSVLNWLRTRDDIAKDQISLWGDSFAQTNGPDVRIEVPLDADLPRYAEPVGGMLVMLGMLYDEQIAAGYANNGLADFSSCLRTPFVYIPADSVIPGVLEAGDLPILALALSNRPIRFGNMVDGLNRPVSAQGIPTAYVPASRGAIPWLRDRIDHK